MQRQERHPALTLNLPFGGFELEDLKRRLEIEETEREKEKLGKEMTDVCIDFLNQPGCKSTYQFGLWRGAVPIHLVPTDPEGKEIENTEPIPAEIDVSYSDPRRGVVVQLSPSSRGPLPVGFKLPDEQFRLFSDQKPKVFNRRTETLTDATLPQLQWLTVIVGMVKQHTISESSPISQF